MTPKLLVVEDDRHLQEIISDYFGSKGWNVKTVDNGYDGLSLLETDQYHLVLLDVMLPGMNGFTVCRKIREMRDIPIIFITALVQEEDELNGYSMGADDYVTKPFSLPVLYAKVTALLGRVQSTSAKRMRLGTIVVDVLAHEVYVDGKRCDVPPIEYEMLLFFMENPGRIFSREQLLIRFWGYDFDGNERVVDNHIRKLRKALEDSGSMIKNVRKAGYRMEVKP